LLQGGFYLDESIPATGTLLPGITAVIAGGMLVVGFFTPIAAVVAVLHIASAALSFFPPVTPNLFDERFPIFLSIAVLIAVTLLGPGGYSIDARRYGRRKIIIPTSGFPR
jgi:uncharacterized membrane protein YphA (DoxX/SURF4 family)